jgi:hypothetical protein
VIVEVETPLAAIDVGSALIVVFVASATAVKATVAVAPEIVVPLIVPVMLAIPALIADVKVAV